MSVKKFKRILVANRGEIAIRIFRACEELGIAPIAVYSEEDKTSLFRTKAQESYLVGKGKSPIQAYLDMDGIISLAKTKGIDAIHPGYGFLAENAEFAKKCEEAGITFIGPLSETISNLGDKINSKKVAKRAGVPTIPGIDSPLSSIEEAIKIANEFGYPVIIKASAGGGGRGMRVVRSDKEMSDAYKSAKMEAKKAFGNDDMFIEKYLENPKHVEVQVLGDNYGNLVHLYERDCSIQRRHQKVIEIAPAFSLTEELRNKICEDAIKIAKEVKYSNAGTMEFLVDNFSKHYFIEVNPRIQVEHTITEMTTGIDIVQSQILIAEGHRLDDKEINIKSQDDIKFNGYAIQCRVTTEDPANNFAPDTGRIDVYRTGSGFGVRLDGGNGFAGSIISPYYDSLLVKVTTHSRNFEDAIKKSIRSLRELKISGVKTNIGFLLNVLNNEIFKKGLCTTGFIAENPHIFDIKPRNFREVKLLNFIGENVVNNKKRIEKSFDNPVVPVFEKPEKLSGTKYILDDKGPKGLVDWIKSQDKLLLTDTTLRDAHQSLMATRMRTVDMLKIAEATSVLCGDLFSLEMWGGATFDVAYRFLFESPWERLEKLREKIPNILFQMLLRGNNTVGYKNYPDNVVKKFITEASKSGIDIFRIFDSLNWIEGMRYAIEQVVEKNKIAEGCICYTGDILDEKRDKYSLKYYVDMAKELEKAGAHILGIKDMSALLKPYAAHKLVKALKNEISIPIHLHTHDTTGNGVATLIMATEAGVDIVDTAFDSMSGLTSQPALNSIVAAFEATERSTGLLLDNCNEISSYWAGVRPIYENFESDLKSGTTEIYRYEIPGGQYSNLKPQVESFGLGNKFKEVKEMYKSVNDMMGDIVKVTPSSKMVGDMAIFMVQNELTPENIYEKGKTLDYPDSVISYFKGMMGQPLGGFPKKLQKLVLKGEKPITVRPGELLEDEDFDAIRKHLTEKFNIEPTEKDIISYALYPKVFETYLKTLDEKGDFHLIDSKTFFHGISVGQTAEVKIDEGVVIITKLISISNVDEKGYRTLTFEVNGSRREIKVLDKSAEISSEKVFKQMADPSNEKEIGASIPGTVLKVLIKEGEKLEKNKPLMVIEAMKMETNVVSNVDGVVDKIYVKENQIVESGELIIKLK